jgi:hypothetical protein
MIYLMMKSLICFIYMMVSMKIMNKNRMIAFYVAPSDFSRIVAVAKQEYCTMAAFCRRVVMRRVEEAEAEVRRGRGTARAPFRPE